MATQITFDYVLYLNNSLVFRFNNGDAFCMKSFSDGIMVISPLGGCDLTAYAKNIAGCFDEGSNLYGLKTIIFSFNGAEVSITKENAHIIITIFGLKMTFKNILINPLDNENRTRTG